MLTQDGLEYSTEGTKAHVLFDLTNHRPSRHIGKGLQAQGQNLQLIGIVATRDAPDSEQDDIAIEEAPNSIGSFVGVSTAPSGVNVSAD